MKNSTVEKRHFNIGSKGLRLLICVFAAVIAAMLFATHARAASSEEEDFAPEIRAFNLSLNDTIYIEYAVYVPESVDAFGLLIWQGEAPDKYVHDRRAVDITQSSGYTDIEGERLCVFAYKGLAIKEMSDEVFAVPYIVTDGEYVYGEPQKYSVVQYAYAMRHDEELRPLLDSLLNLGAHAQEYFNYNTERLASDSFVKVTLHNARLDDGTDFGMFIAGKEKLPVPVPAEESSGIFGGWYKDADFTEKLDTVTASTTDAYAKWVEPIVDTDFSAPLGPTQYYKVIGGVMFNNESSATLETLTDEGEAPYLKYSSGSSTSVYASNTYADTALSDMLDTDVFSFSFRLRAEKVDSILTGKVGLRTEKTASGVKKVATVSLFDILSDGSVKSYGGEELCKIVPDAVTSVNIAVNFADSTFTYYDEDGAVIFREEFDVPSGLGVTGAKAWQKLIQKYLFYASFGSGSTLLFYDIIISEGNIFA